MKAQGIDHYYYYLQPPGLGFSLLYLSPLCRCVVLAIPSLLPPFASLFTLGTPLAPLHSSISPLAPVLFYFTRPNRVSLSPPLPLLFYMLSSLARAVAISSPSPPALFLAHLYVTSIYTGEGRAVQARSKHRRPPGDNPRVDPICIPAARPGAAASLFSRALVETFVKGRIYIYTRVGRISPGSIL